MNVLHLVHRFPYPPDKGDRIRSYHTLRYLADRARVYLACLADEPVPPEALDHLRHHCAEVAVVSLSRRRWLRAAWLLASGRSATEGAFNSPELRQVLSRWNRQIPFDFSVVSSSSMIPYLRRSELRAVPAVVDLVDVDSQKWLDYAAASRFPRSWLYRLEGHRLRRLESDLPSWARAVILTTPYEVKLYEDFAGPGTAQAVPNGVDLDYFHPSPPAEAPICVFVGALDYRPNSDGIVWFCEAVWPALRQVVPTARLRIVGRKPVAAVEALAGLPGVEVVGTVPDVRPYLTEAAAAVVPLRIARGVQNKVLEAMAAARPVVASRLCLQGLATVPGTHLLSVETPAEWVEALQSLLSDSGRRQQLGAAARAFVEEHHCWDRCLAPLGELLGQDERESA